MKKRLLFLLSFVCSLFAAPIGNPAAPSLLDTGMKIPDTAWWNLRFGLCEEIILEQKYDAPERNQIKGAFVRGETQAVSATWNVRERFDLQALLGWGELRWQWRREGISEEGTANHGFYWNTAAKLIIFQIKGSVLSADVRGGGWHDFSGSFRVDHGEPQSGDFSSLFWQASLAFSQQVGCLCPYFGLALQQDSLSIHSVRLTNQYNKGPFGGLSFTNGSYLFVNIEGCGWIETSCSFSCEIRL